MTNARKMPKSNNTKAELEARPDGWRRFERAVDAAVKGGPRHRPSKPPTGKRNSRKKPSGQV